jgi:hypothetical protein
MWMGYRALETGENYKVRSSSANIIRVNKSRMVVKR